MKTEIKVDEDTLKKIPDERLQLTVKYIGGQLEQMQFALHNHESGKQTLSESELNRIMKQGKVHQDRIKTLARELDRRAIEVISHIFK